jgi:hypothetical protein
MASFKKISTLLSIKQHFRQWREQFTKVVSQEKIAFYAMSNVQGAVLRKCFDAFKSLHVKAQTDKGLKLKNVESLRRRAFFWLRKVTAM